MLQSLLSIGRKGVSFVHHIVVQILFRLFEYILPVRDDFWCFCTWQDYSHTIDNPRAVFEVVKDDSAISKIVLQKDTDSPPSREGRRVRFVKAESVRGAYYLARSRVVLIGYALRGMSSYSWKMRDGRHDVVQLWHGIALKRIGLMVPEEDIWHEESPRYDVLLASSEEDREVMARAFAPVPRERIWLTGLPRNDIILKDTRELPADYRGHLQTLEDRLNGRSLVLYAPTWRASEEDLYSFSADERERLETILRRHGAVLGIRGHVKVRRHDAYAERAESSVIITVNGFPDVNVILRRTDVLITDYSSIYIDYLLRDRPVIHFAYDLEAYAEKRGFVYEPERAFGGPTATTFESLAEHLDRSLEDRTYFRSQRQTAFELYHAHGEEAGKAVCGRIRKLAGLCESGAYPSKDQ